MQTINSVFINENKVSLLSYAISFVIIDYNISYSVFISIISICSSRRSSNHTHLIISFPVCRTLKVVEPLKPDTPKTPNSG